MQICNVNVRCRATLTDFGREILRKEHPYLLKTSHWNEEKKELETELWNLMNIFGPYLYMGMTDIPFVKNEMRIMEKLG